jgi:Tol biopolymer transport system component
MEHKHRLDLILLLGTALISAVLLSGCGRARPVAFPDTEIIYQTSDFNTASLGFVNADGSNQSILTLDFHPARPAWSSDGKTVYYINVPGNILFDSAGYASYWEEGRALSTCRQSSWWGVTLVGPANPEQSDQAIVVKSSAVVLRVDLEKCREVETILERSSPTTSLHSASLSKDGNILAFSVFDKGESSYSIFVRDLKRDQEIEIGEGINPTISPDNRWVAYTGFDGIYLAKIDGTQHQQIVAYDAAGSLGSSFEVAPPAPNWSPDSKWLIYHQCVEKHPDNCHHADEFQIFKVEVKTGAITTVVEGGTYPYWRKK